MAYRCKLYRMRECDGCGDCQEEKIYNCPVCGAEVGGGDTLYIDNYGNTLGCEKCVFSKEAADILEN